MRVRYEPFGGIVALRFPPLTLYVNRAFMRALGYTGSPLWEREDSHLSAPVTVHFAVTNRCPLECRICYNLSGPSRSDELSTAEARAVLETLARMGVFTVTFGGGEPLARSDIFELAEYARHLGMVPTMTTNGYCVDQQVARRCRVFRHVHISLDGDEEVYTRVRGVEGFGRAVRAIELLVKNGVQVGINCIVCRENFGQLEELVRFLVTHKVRDILFLRLKPFGRALSSYMSLRLEPAQSLALFPLLRRLTVRYRIRAHVDCAMMPFIYWHRPEKKRVGYLAVGGCVGGNEIVEIQPDGQVNACSFAAGETFPVSRLEELWPAAFSDYRQWAERAPEPCRSCEYLVLCQGGCHAAARALTGDWFAPDPECPFVLRWKGEI